MFDQKEDNQSATLSQRSRTFDACNHRNQISAGVSLPFFYSYRFFPLPFFIPQLGLYHVRPSGTQIVIPLPDYYTQTNVGLPPPMSLPLIDVPPFSNLFVSTNTTLPSLFFGCANTLFPSFFKKYINPLPSLQGVVRYLSQRAFFFLLLQVLFCVTLILSQIISPFLIKPHSLFIVKLFSI